MKRRDFIGQSASFGMICAAAVIPDSLSTAVDPVNTLGSIATAGKLTPPAKGKIPIAFAISEGVTVIDFAGPWEVFQDVHVQTRGKDMDDAIFVYSSKETHKSRSSMNVATDEKPFRLSKPSLLT